MKLLLDQGLPRSAAALLRQAGIDAAHVGEIGHSSSDDATILQVGRDAGAVVVTLDADFHSLLALSAATSPSVIRVRIEGLRGPSLAELLQQVLSRCGKDLRDGAMVTVQAGRIRIRLLPLRSGHSDGEGE
jgi:predicted nuclease of predicted toxin-antitoxin system